MEHEIEEAVIKALGGPEVLSFREMEVVGGGNVRPEIVLSGRAKEVAARRGVVSFHLTITHSAGIAAAVVVAESAQPIGG